ISPGLSPDSPGFPRALPPALPGSPGSPGSARRCPCPRAPQVFREYGFHPLAQRWIIGQSLCSDGRSLG
ncbi:HOIL1 protein, partial [Dyaphorophyia castanea]|nr:HOIL1 protein [Platysteira castanea]